MVGTRLSTRQWWLWSPNLTPRLGCTWNVVGRLQGAVGASPGMAPGEEGCGETGEQSLETIDLPWAWGQGEELRVRPGGG